MDGQRFVRHSCATLPTDTLSGQGLSELSVDITELRKRELVYGDMLMRFSSGLTRIEREQTMPVVQIALYAGRTPEQKAALAKAVTKAISETAGIPDEATTIIFQDVPKHDWVVGGVPASQQ